eukprot:scaffold923_cov256-Pinguiococcus_pyrenoidosus.AAC.34
MPLGEIRPWAGLELRSAPTHFFHGNPKADPRPTLAAQSYSGRGNLRERASLQDPPGFAPSAHE